MSERYDPTLGTHPLRYYFTDLRELNARDREMTRQNGNPSPRGYVYVCGGHVNGEWRSIYGAPTREVCDAVAPWLFARLVSLELVPQWGGEHEGQCKLLARDSVVIGTKVVGIVSDCPRGTFKEALAAIATEAPR